MVHFVLGFDGRVYYLVEGFGDGRKVCFSN